MLGTRTDSSNAVGAEWMIMQKVRPIAAALHNLLCGRGS